MELKPRTSDTHTQAMAITFAQIPKWEEIDQAESYLVCCMFDEAASLASSILERLLANYEQKRKGSEFSENCYDENEWDDMVESAGMVLVQSLNQLKRTSEILKELKGIFGSVTAVPVQVFLTGVCFEMQESPLTNVQGFLVEFLDGWTYEDEKYHSVTDAETCIPGIEGSRFRFCIEVDKYLEVVELYVITLLALTLKDMDRAISWVKKAILPEEKHQELLRRLNSMTPMVTTSSQTSITSRLPNESRTKPDFLREQRPYNGHQEDSESGYVSSGRNTTKEEILKLSRQKVPVFSWFPIINLKCGNTQFIIPSGRILLASLLLLLYYSTRKKHAALKRVLAEKARSMKNAVFDLWQLAFSYQVNPLAAVQPLPTATRGSR